VDRRNLNQTVPDAEEMCRPIQVVSEVPSLKKATLETNLKGWNVFNCLFEQVVDQKVSCFRFGVPWPA
jgi:hypothetical protein